MAIDRTLLDSVAGGAPPAVRFYRWSPATLSFGRNQPARGLYDEDAARARGIDFVRRPTGGQAVLHDDELTYAVVAPVTTLGKPRTAYRRINEAIVAGLRAMGVEAAVADAAGGTPGSGARSKSEWTAACFRAPERGEVVVGRRKLVGSAQRTERDTILQHGSILLGGSQAAAESLLRDPAPDPARAEEGWTTVEAALGRRPGTDDVVGALVTSFETVLGIQLAASSLSVEEGRDVGRWTERFASTEWTWRR